MKAEEKYQQREKENYTTENLKKQNLKAAGEYRQRKKEEERRKREQRLNVLKRLFGCFLKKSDGKQKNLGQRMKNQF